MRSAVGIVGLAGVLAALLACGDRSAAPADAPSPAPPTAPPRDTLVVAVESDLGNLNPAVYETGGDADVLANLAFPNLDMTFDCAIRYRPGLYASWTFDPDGAGLTVKLRDDVVWSDGVPVTAQDVAFLYDLVRDPGVASANLALTESLLPGFPQAVDATTLRFRFTHAYDRDTMLSHAGGALPALPRHVFQDADRGSLAAHPRSRDPLSSGPWRLAAHEAGTRYVLEPNTAFTGPAELRPKLARVVFKILPEYGTRLLELERGDVDLMASVAIPDVDRLRAEHPELDLVSRGWREMDYIGWNTRNPLFADVEVRTALSLAIDVDGMIARLLTGRDGHAYGRRAVGTFTPELCALDDPALTPVPHDPARARALLAAAGWTDHDGDGWIDKDGRPFRFTLVTNAGNQRRADTAVLVQAALKEVGVDAQLEQRESNAFFAALRARTFDAALAGWSASLFVDPSPFWACDRPDRPVPYNLTGWCDPAVDALIDQGLATPDPAVSTPIWREVQARIHAAQPYTFLWWRDDVVAVHRRFTHREIDVLSTIDHLSAWDVPPDQVKYRD